MFTTHNSVLPADVNVLFDQLVLILNCPVQSRLIPDTKTVFQYIPNTLDPMKVPVNQVQSRLFEKAFAAIITSPAPLLASKNTFSPIGTLAPLAPPELVAQFVVESQ